MEFSLSLVRVLNSYLELAPFSWDLPEKITATQVVKKVKVKVKQFHSWSGQTPGVPGGWGFQISKQSTHEGGNVVSHTHRSPVQPKEKFLVLISVRGWVNPKAIVRPEGLYQWKIPTRDLPFCSAVPQPTVPPRTAVKKVPGLITYILVRNAPIPYCPHLLTLCS
jgi:hypothetical protein